MLYPLTSTATLVTSFLFTPNVPDSLTSQMSHYWMERALFHYGQMVDTRTRTLWSLQDLRDAYDLPRQAFFSYLQIRHFAQSLVTNFQFSPLTEFEKICLEGSSPKGMILRTYQLPITDLSPTWPRHAYMCKWEQTLGKDIPLKTWQLIWAQAPKSSICMLYKEN